MDNSVMSLKKIRFSQLSLQEKLSIKAQGRPTPNLDISQSSTSRGNPYARKFNRNVYDDHDWLCGCNSENAFFCFPCLLFGGDQEHSWTKVGVKDLKHLSRKTEKHSRSTFHMNNTLSLSVLGRVNIATLIDSGYQLSITKHNEEVTKNRTVLSKIIDCIKFCGRFELPLRGHDESQGSKNPGVFMGLIDFASNLDSRFQNHFNSAKVFKGTSKTIQNELLETILELCKSKIKEEISQSEFVAIMCDETTDISEKTQMVIVLRYESHGKPVERFWGFFNPANQTAEALSSILFQELKVLLGSNTSKLVAQTYDGAAAMSGARNGVQSRIKQVYSNAHFVHCYAHQLNLVIQKATSQNTSVRVFFNSLSGIPSFFSKSPQRMAALDQVAQRRIPRPSATRWNFKSRTVNAVSEVKDALIECCSTLEQSNSSVTGFAAAGIKRMLIDPKFVFWLDFFSKIMPHVDILFAQLQSVELESFKVQCSLDNFLSAIQRIREGIAADNESPSPTRRMPESQIIDAKEVCDVVLMQCQERFKFTNHLEASTLFNLKNASQYARQFPEKALEKCCEAYPMLIKDKLKPELSVLYSRNDMHSVSGLVQLLSLLNLEGMQSTFSEVIKLAKILLTTPMSTAEPERCFSSLKRIKTFSRSTMCTERLSALAMVSIENRLITETKDFNERVIDHFAMAKSRRMEFIYK